MTGNFTLRNYQTEPVQQVKDLLAAGTATVLVAPTGAGKTVMAAEVVAWAVEQGMQVLFLAHRKELLRQARTALEAHGLHADDRVTIMGIGRALRHGPDHVDLLVIDESHRAASKTYKAVIAKYPDAKRLGLTATPERTDGRGLDDVFSTMVQTPGLRALIDAGHLCDFRVYSAKNADLKALEELRRKAGDFDRQELGRIMNTPKLVGPIVEHWGEHAMEQKRPTLVFAASRLHAISIQNAFREAGITAEVVDGQTNHKKRKDVLADLAEGRLNVLVSVDLFTEGWDCPPVSCIIHARPTLSLILWLQSVGRGMRKCDGKQDLIILDHAANFDRHGWPDEDRQWSLQGELERKRLEKEKRRAERDLELTELAAELEEKNKRTYNLAACAVILGVPVSSVWRAMKCLGIRPYSKLYRGSKDTRYLKEDLDRYAKFLNETYLTSEIDKRRGKTRSSMWLSHRGIKPVRFNPHTTGPVKGTSTRYLKTEVDAAFASCHWGDYTAVQLAVLLKCPHIGSVALMAKNYNIPVTGHRGRAATYSKQHADQLVALWRECATRQDVLTCYSITTHQWVYALKKHHLLPVAHRGVAGLYRWSDVDKVFGPMQKAA